MGNDGTVGSPVVASISNDPVALGRVNFASTSSVLSAVAKRKLDSFIRLAAQAGFTKLVLAGQTDDVGGATGAQSLSMNRAKAVRTYLSAKAKASGTQLIVQAVAEKQPTVSNSTPRGKAVNRRVEVLVR